MCEISDKFVDINLCSCAAVSDVDHIYNTLIQSFKGFIVDLLADDIRYLDDVVRGDDAYQFKSMWIQSTKLQKPGYSLPIPV